MRFKRIIGFFIFLCASSDISWTQNEALSIQSPVKGGDATLIYKAQGFHIDSQALIVEISSYSGTQLAKTVITGKGQTLNLIPANCPIIIPHANSHMSENSQYVLQFIELAATRFPQYKERLEALKMDWQGIQSVAQEKEQSKVTNEPAIPEQPQGKKFRGMDVVNTYPDGLSISSDEGIRKVAFKDFTDEEKVQFNYDPVKESEYVANITEQRRKLQDAEIEKQKQKAIVAEEKKRPQFSTEPVLFNNSRHIRTVGDDSVGREIEQGIKNEADRNAIFERQNDLSSQITQIKAEISFMNNELSVLQNIKNNYDNSRTSGNTIGSRAVGSPWQLVQSKQREINAKENRLRELNTQLKDSYR